ncbi:PD-(D/E)XK nuclease family protein [Bacillus cereus]|uniref:PD-(D/E)XK nuclease family protein n=1 Tax=Bacillus cereus TaxID=1396 RepID=UPI003D64D6B4
MDKRPNLFSHGTSELSQDAFICWLVEWANPIYKETDECLHEAGIGFIRRIYDLHKKTFPATIKEIKITKQFKGLDILIEINGNQAILIEDKTYTKEHSNQLKRYYEEVVKLERYNECDLLPIYYKIGNQSDYSAVIDAKYKLFTRKQMLEFLQESIDRGVQDQIFLDYYFYLGGIDQKYNSYKTLPLSEWKGEAWEGFYEELNQHGIKGQYGYVANPNGGFYAFWWNEQKNKECKQYLQLEEGRLCFKIQVADKYRRKELRDKWSKALIEQSHEYSFNVEKPRFGNGRYMTVAVVRDYRVGDGKGRIDVSRTMGVLGEVERLLKIMDV